MRASTIRRTTTPLAIALAAAAGVLVPARPVVVAADSGIQPFYLEQTTSGEMSNGMFAPERTKTVARRADGVTAVIDGLGPTFSARVRRVMWPDGHAITVWENVHLKTTWPDGDDDALAIGSRLRHASPNCRSSGTLLRLDTIRDQPVAVLENAVLKGGLPVYTYTSWKALGLACEEMYHTSQKTLPDGSLRLQLETITTNLQLGEPDPRLFAVDADYAESKPSAGLIALIHWAKGDALPATEEAELRHEGEELDQIYQSPAPKP